MQLADEMEVSKLGPQHQAHTWTDGVGTLWRWTDATAWQYQQDGEWLGSYWTVEGAPPYRSPR